MQPKSFSEIRSELKLLLFLFAKESNQPGLDLQELLREVIHELHDQVKEATRSTRKLKLVQPEDSPIASA
jgi:hypothetical protein